MDKKNDDKYPQSRAEMSFDYKLFFVFHGCMAALLIIGRILPIELLFGFVITLLFILVGLSINHRIKSEWHWPGVQIKDILQVVLGIALGLFFLGSSIPLISPLNPAIFPWFAAGGGIILFGALSSLNIVFLTETEYQTHCGDQKQTEPEPKKTSNDPLWKRGVRSTFTIYALVVWIASVSHNWQFNIALRDGSPEPTQERTEILRDHGTPIFVTKKEKRIVSLLKYSWTWGIPSIFVLGALIHFVIGVKLFSNAPTLAEKMRERD